MLTQTKILIGKPYLTKKLGPNAVSAALSAGHQTAYRLLLTVNGLKERQTFCRLNNKAYSLTAYVRTDSSPVGECREQIQSIPVFRDILKKRSKITVCCDLIDYETNKSIFKFSNETTKTDTVFSNIEYCVKELSRILECEIIINNK